MGLFNLFKRVDINAEVEAMKSIENAVLLDVRSKEEYSGGHIPGSKNVPVENIEKVVDVIADKNTPVFVYCLRGSRSASAVSAITGISKLPDSCNLCNVVSPDIFGIMISIRIKS